MLKAIGTSIAILCLAAASYEDFRTHKVSDLTWWIMAPSCLLLIPGAKELPGLWELFECLYVIFIQEHIMSGFYGRADSHAFSCCALYLAVCGSGLEAHILHMSLSLVSLTVIQLLHHNINRHGRLNHPVPFIPYISATFLLCAGVL